MPSDLIFGFVQRLLASRVRGSTRATLLLAKRLKRLQALPFKVRGGEICLDLRVTSAHGLMIAPDVEEDELEIASRLVKSGDVVFDIGAHFGIYTVLFSSLVGNGGKVFAFEPNPLVLPALRETIERLANATLLTVAVSDRSGEEILYVPEQQTMASLRDWTENQHGAIKQFSCRTQKLDDLLKSGAVRQPQFIKCDIEGGETNCFRGATDILNRSDAPIILFEANINNVRGYGVEISSATEFLASLEKPQYVFFKVDKRATLAKLSGDAFSSANILAVPGSRRAEVEDFIRNN